ncbi:MAG TPA: glycogen debranching N-terminal domain-containing protein [Candidatus Polarisedimenticolaceae bacterium]|nr:glycogen debranching N-terminal domain-containing protein [Candidatus Polarisedimenticolaceae bacterium]
MIDVPEGYEIQVEGGTMDERTLVTVRGDTFALFDRLGDILPPHYGRHGLFHAGTRFLSRLQIMMWQHRPALLSASVHEEDGTLIVHLTNPDIRDQGAWSMPRHSVHLVRRVRLEEGRCHVDCTFRNYGAETIVVPFELRFASDFVDLFEVRGAVREKRGTLLPVDVGTDEVRLRYYGLDGILRVTRIVCHTEPKRADETSIAYDLTLPRDVELSLSFTIDCEIEEHEHRHFRKPSSAPSGRWRTEIAASQAAFDAWIRRSRSDLAMLTAVTQYGPFPYAGVPWFCTPFGRDALITAYEVLWLAPEMARGVLRFLAAHQALHDDPDRDAEPGKILHEMRAGEMPNLGEVPFGRYYGSVDSTPLFVLLAAAYHERTNDLDLMRDLWPALELAIEWMEGPGDLDGDGFIEYRKRGPHGLDNQGWKDSRDSIMHEDGTLAEGPIALCEVQAYAYAARAWIAPIARRLGHTNVAEKLARDAEKLKRAFQETYWLEDLGTYALALDGDKRPCRVRSSNAGHTLFTGIAAPEHASILSQTLLSADHFSGWGVSTLARSAPRYNPMAYHNGSVWPHDNALIGIGLARYGETLGCERILTALFEASRAIDVSRLPELMCGFPRQPGEAPTLYPVACSPQAWAAGSVFLLLHGMLGLSINAESRQIRLAKPRMPSFLHALTIRNLRVGEGELDLFLDHHDGEVVVRVLRRTASVDLILS